MLSVYIIFPEKVYHFYFKHIIGAKVTDLVVLIAINQNFTLTFLPCGS